MRDSNICLAALVETIAGLVPRHSTTAVVAIDGPSGSGKSTLAQQLADALAFDGSAGRRVAVLHLDDLLPGWDGLAEVVPNLLRWVLQPLGTGRPARYQRYDWEADHFAEWHQLPVVEVLIVEGVGSGAREAAPWLDLLLWIQAPRAIRFDRGIARDGPAYLPNWERWAIQEAAMFAREQTLERADIRVDGTQPIR